jgi:hypothetical protein
VIENSAEGIFGPVNEEIKAGCGKHINRSFMVHIFHLTVVQ